MSDEESHSQVSTSSQPETGNEENIDVTEEMDVPPDCVREFSEPKMLGRYRLCFELAAGGMAKVFLALSQGPGGFEKLVAVKQIHEHLSSSEDVVEMFLDEARLAARIDHPNVCSVFDFGLVDGTYYLAMEYLPGETLVRLMKKIHADEQLSQSPMLPALAARIFADACEGLHAAHELRDDRGELLHLIHRDISPTNLFVTYDGSIKLMDFGVAKAADRIQTTREGQIKGKFAYIAPERLRADCDDLDRRADIWSMGVVLWEFLAGRRLFYCKGHAETVMAVLKRDVPLPSQLNPRIPSVLDEIIIHTLSRDRDKRFGTARELGRALDKFNAVQSSSALAADVSELMAKLFPKERARKQQMIELARQIGDSAVLRIDGGPSKKDGAGTIDSGQREIPSLPPIPPDLVDEDEDERGSRKRMFSRAFWALGLLAGGALVLIMLFLFGGEEEPTENGRERDGVTAVASSDPDGPPPVSSLPAGSSKNPGGTERPASESDGASATVENVEAPSAASSIEERAPSQPEKTPHDEGSDSAALVTAENQAKSRPNGDRQKQNDRGPPGSVVAVTPGGWADVYLGSKRLGRTPTRLTLPPGRHRLKFMPFGRGPALSKRVRVTPGGSSRVVVRLTE